MSVLAIERYGTGGATNQYYSDNSILQYGRQRWSSIRRIFQQIFLPQGYPESVSEDYLEYQLWDTVQAFASSVTGTLASQAILKGFGVGNEKATILAATITWLMKDGAGMVGRIVFAWTSGTFLDCDCKRWRFFADILNDGAICLELMAPLYEHLFTPIVCVASVAKSIVGVAGGATRAALGVHQARRNNMADVAAKDGSQETMVNLLALLFNFAFIHFVTGNQLVTWISFFVFTAVHLFANYRAVCALRMETFNLTRYLIFTRQYLKSGGMRMLSVLECNRQEPVVFPVVDYRRIKLGCSFAASSCKCPVLLSDIINIFHEEDFLLLPISGNKSIEVVLHESCTDMNMLKAVFTAEIFFYVHKTFEQNPHLTVFECAGLPVERYGLFGDRSDADTRQLLATTLKLSCSIFDVFIRRAHDVGWDLSAALLGEDEWRCDWRLR